MSLLKYCVERFDHLAIIVKEQIGGCLQDLKSLPRYLERRLWQIQPLPYILTSPTVLS